MREHRTRSSGEYRGEPAPVRGQRPVANRVDAVVDAVQAAVSDAVLDSPRPEAERQQLAASDDPVLLPGELRYGAVDRTQPLALGQGGSSLPPYLAVNVCHPWRVAVSLAWVTREMSRLAPDPARVGGRGQRYGFRAAAASGLVGVLSSSRAWWRPSTAWPSYYSDELPPSVPVPVPVSIS